MAVVGFDQTLAPTRKKAPLKGLVLEQCSSVRWVDLVVARCAEFVKKGGQCWLYCAMLSLVRAVSIPCIGESACCGTGGNAGLVLVCTAGTCSTGIAFGCG